MDGNGKAVIGSEKEEVVLGMPVEGEALKKKGNNDLTYPSAAVGSCSFSKDSEISGRILDGNGNQTVFSDLDRLKSEVQATTQVSGQSPEFKLSSSPNKPPKPPTDSLTRQLSLAKSVFSKPKSRFVEPSYPACLYQTEEHTTQEQASHPSYPDYLYRNSSYQASPRRLSVGTPNGNSKSAMTQTPSGAIEEEEEQIYGEYLLAREKWGRRLKFWVMLEWVALISVTALLIASLTIQRLQNLVIWGLELWKWCLLVMVIFCGRMFTDWLIQVLVFLIEMNFVLKKKVLYFVYGLSKSVQVCIWSGLVLLTWFLLFNSRVEHSHKTRKFLDYVSGTLASVMIGAVLCLSKTLFVKILAASFHVNAFFDRIQESIFHQYILQTLSGPPLMALAEKVGSTKSTGQMSFRSTKKGKGGDEQGVIDVAKLHNMKLEKISALTMKGLVDIITSSGLSTITNSIFDSFHEDGEQKDEEITSVWEAKAAAYQIFRNVAKPDCKYIDEEDLMRFLIKEEVDIILPQFEGAVETGKVKKSAMRNWVVKVYLERKSLAHSLNDTKTAVKQLNKLASGVVIVLTIIIWLLLMGFATTNVLVFISSQMLMVVFIFGNTCKMIFEAIIFVFVLHPFDVGDRCVIDGVQMVVEEMNILTTIFLRYDNEKIYYPNAVLATKPIGNFYRSPNMGDSVEFSIDVRTSKETIGALKDKIKRYIESKPQHWHPNHSVIVNEIEDMNKMKMVLYVLHTMNYQNMEEKNNRRSDLVFELKNIFEELAIKYHLLPQEVHLSYVDSQNPQVTIARR